MIRRPRLSTKLLFPGVIGTLSFSGVLLLMLSEVRDYAYRAKAESTRHLVESAASLVDRYGREEARGAMSREAAQAGALTELRAMRYAGDGYFWVNDMDARMVMHPTNPGLNGKDVSGNRDPNGVPLFLEMIAVCRRSGAGAVRYSWPKPGNSTPLPKVSYVQAYPPWQWVIGSGVYADDVDAEVWALARMPILRTLVIAVLFGALTFFITSRGIKPLETAVGQLTETSAWIQSAAAGVLDTSRVIATGASEQADYVRGTSRSVGDLAQAMSASTAAAAGTDSLLSEVRQTVETGSGQMSRMSEAMAEISNANRRAAAIADAIEEIAFQTNLLALNAAVEAARAGRHGVGFAVVADEVRRLSGRASEAAQTSRAEMGQTLSKLSEGAVIATDMMRTFEDLSGKIQGVMQKSALTTEATSAESARVADIQRAFERMDAITETNAAGSKQTEAIAAELESHAGELSRLIRPLNTILYGTEGPGEAQAVGDARPAARSRRRA